MCASVSSILISHSSPFLRFTPDLSTKVRVARMCSAFCEGLLLLLAIMDMHQSNPQQTRHNTDVL